MIACPVSVIATGDYEPGAIAIRRVALPELPAKIEEFIEAKWQREVELNPRLYSGPILSPAAIRISAEKIEIDCGVSNYRQFMGTTWPEIPERFRRKALGQMAVTVTSDNRLVIGVRSRSIDWGGLRHALPAGRVQPDEGTPEEAILLEFREEAGTGSDNIESLRCVGVLEDITSGRHNYEIIYLARVRYSANELVEAARSAEHSFEHDRIEAYAWDRTSIADLLSTDPRSFSPIGFAGIALALRHAFGADAFPDWDPQPMTYEEYRG